MPIARLKRVIQARLGTPHGIVHSVGTLVGGTAFAQGLSILALPLLTRLYTPSDFSILAIYASVLGILTVVACLRLEIAIPLPGREEDAASLLVLALASGLGLSLLTAMAVLLFGDRIASSLGVPAFAPYLWLVPIGVCAASAYNAIQYWSTRKKKFQSIAGTRMVQAVGGVGLQVGAGVLGAGPIGLLLGQMFNSGAGFWKLGRDAWLHDKEVLRAVTIPSIRAVLRSYSRFPKYSTFEALANTAGIQVPVIVIAALALGPEAGYLMLATRLMGVPMTLVGGAISQVYLAHASEELRQGDLGGLTERILTGLIRTGVGPLLFAGIVADPVAGIVFGKDWARVGELVGWMTPWFILQFLSSPVSMAMHVTGRQRQMLVIALTGLFVRLGAMMVAYASFRNLFSEAYAFSGALFYGLCCLVFYRASGLTSGQAVAALRRGTFPLLGWLGCALALKYAVEMAI